MIIDNTLSKEFKRYYSFSSLYAVSVTRDQ